MAPVSHSGRLLKRKLVARKLSANRLSLDIGVPSGRIIRRSWWTGFRRRFAIPPVMLVLILVTTNLVPQGSTAAGNPGVARAAQDCVATRFPDFDIAGSRPIVQDRGDSWEVEYEMPAGVIGGTPVVVIEKNTLKVLRCFHTQ